MGMVKLPPRQTDKPMRMPVSGIYKIKGVGDVVTGRVEQGVVNPGDEVAFLPTHTSSNKCAGKVFSIEMHHSRIEKAMPGDVMILLKDPTLKSAGTFTALVQVLDIPGEIKSGYCPTVFVRTGHSSCRLTAIEWKIGKETGGKKAEAPHSLKSNEMAQCVFAPIQPLVVDSFGNCEGLSRLAVMEGNGVVMLGKCVSTTEREEKAKAAAPGGKKK